MTSSQTLNRHWMPYNTETGSTMLFKEYEIGTRARAFSTMRGEGSGNYGGFNITHYCGDTAEHVAECRAMLCKELNIEDSNLILPRQTHSDRIITIDKVFMQMTREEQEEALYGADAIMTELSRTCIGVSTADCIPILLLDSVRGVAAAIHAGWRGTVAGIVTKTIGAMQQSHGCNASDMQAIIAPGISVDAFEVGDEVYDAFEKAGFPMNEIAVRYPTADGGEKWHIDLWEANRHQLLQCGVAENDIVLSGICTFTNHHEFFSARRLGINSGRIFSGIMLL